MSRSYVTATKLDASGKATLSAKAAAGTYYFFAIVPNAGGSLVWDIPANLVAGRKHCHAQRKECRRGPVMPKSGRLRNRTF